MKYKVVEKFVSVNGEGNLIGQLAVFVRFAGCNLQCSYCDTMWANKVDASFELMSEAEIYQYIKSTKVNNITITGGEPLMQDGIFELLELLSKDETINIEIETNGSIGIKQFSKLTGVRPTFTIDYKLITSNMEGAMLTENYSYLEAKDSVKFVAGSLEDLEKAKFIINKYDLLNKCNVHLDAVFGKISLASIVDFMKENNMNRVKLTPQIHKFIWDPNLRGV